MFFRQPGNRPDLRKPCSFMTGATPTRTISSINFAISLTNGCFLPSASGVSIVAVGPDRSPV